MNLIYSVVLSNYQSTISNTYIRSLIVNFPFSFISGPFIYFYFRDEIHQYSTFKISDLIHFIPFLIYILFAVSSNIENHQFKFAFNLAFEKYAISNNSFLYIVRILQIFLYFTLSLILSFNRFGISYIPESKLNIVAPFVIILLGIICLAFYPYFFFIFLYNFDIEYNFIFSISIILGTSILIKAFIWKFPLIIASINNSISLEISESLKRKPELILSKEQVELYTLLIREYLNSKPTRDTKFAKYHLISAVGLPEYLINCYFNQYLGVSFGSWKTQQRIQDSIELIECGFLSSKTIESLAKEVGFSSRSRFVEAFTKLNNCSPTEYHKLISERG